MDTFVELKTKTGRTLLIQVDSAPASGATVGSVTSAIKEKAGEISEGAGAMALQTVSDLGDAVATVCGDLIEKFNGMEAQRRPSQVEMEFALKLSAEGNVKIIKLGGDGTFQVKMTWSAATGAPNK